MAYAIWNSKYKKWLYGTDFRFWNRHSPRQILDDDTPKLWCDESTAIWEYERRHCGREYKVVEVEVLRTCEVKVKGQEQEYIKSESEEE